MDWARDLAGWPLADLSRQITTRPHRWHVQQAGQGETIVLLHGAGASTHSWRDVVPILAQSYHVVALDLPGHGFTRLGTRTRSALEPVSEDVAALIRAQGWQPAALIGHSAGAAVALRLAQRMARDGAAPRVIGINPALDHFEGVAGWLFPILAKALALNPLTPWMFTLGNGSPRRAQQLIERTGSTLPPEGYDYYARLLRDRDHVGGTLQMMASWSLTGLLRDLPDLAAPTLFLAAERDSAVPPRVPEAAATRMPAARLIRLPGLGHLAHEEDPALVAQQILRFLQG